MPAAARRTDPETERTLELAAQLRLLVSKLNRRLREQAAFGDFTFSQIKVLTRIERDGPATVSALAEAEGMRPQSMSTIVTTLKTAGMLEGSPDPSDGRQTLLSLTAACRNAIAASRAAKVDWLFGEIQSRYAPAEQKQLAGAIDLLSRLIP